MRHSGRLRRGSDVHIVVIRGTAEMEGVLNREFGKDILDILDKFSGALTCM